MTKKRVLNILEKQLSKKKFQSYKTKLIKNFDDDIHIIRKGNFTIAVLKRKKSGNLEVGVAKRRPTDFDQPGIGIAIALTRAISKGR